MREIKFRAWVYYGEKLKKPHYSQDYGSLSRFFEDHDENDIDQCIEQYVGLKDKNGKEIYEGDIVRDLGGNHEVKFCEMKDTDCSYFYQGWGFDDSSLYEEHDFVEVIGNIHENPELLEREDAKG